MHNSQWARAREDEALEDEALEDEAIWRGRHSAIQPNPRHCTGAL